MNNKTMTQEATTPLQWTLPTFTEPFSVSSLFCFGFVGLQLCGNSAIDNTNFTRRGLRPEQLGSLFFYECNTVPLERINGTTWNTENPHAAHHENSVHSSDWWLARNVSKTNCGIMVLGRKITANKHPHL